VVGSLAITTLAVAVLETVAGIPNASATYLLAVVFAAVVAGPAAGVVASLGAFVLYDFLFTVPVHRLDVEDPGEWLTLLLLLFVAVVVGQLAAVQRDRAEAAVRREREARSLFHVSRTLAAAGSTEDALGDIVQTVRDETEFSRVRIVLHGAGGDRAAADTDAATPFPAGSVSAVLQRRAGDEPAEWMLVHDRSVAGARSRRGDALHRVTIEAGRRRLGMLWATRPSSAGPPAVEETRLLAAVVDQVAQSLERDRLAAEATAAEVARRGDALKSALLDAVSHDLRTPLASIRAAAGGLMDDQIEWADDERRAAAETIDREAQRLSRLVANLLELGRIEGGALHAVLEPYVLSDAVADSVARLRPVLDLDGVIDIDVPDDLPAVLVDAVLLDQIVANLVENAARHAPGSAIGVRARARPGGDDVRLTVEDSGSGVPDTALPHLFEKFFRVRRSGEGARRGTGIGLAIVRGLAEAMGGRVAARRSTRGGLAIDVDLPIATPAASTVDRSIGA
ncbi:MAG: ATP-binding protein, partial [Chloroflexota bacterium]